ncbi:MAG: two component transcriptional regulator, winged helix family [Rickettsiaceae bacterium]|jgi:two-component system KDP operon response regulator KdpE|nr:two component transcriptional regulator, winged helix family [Rickettsiaceae bacterium]
MNRKAIKTKLLLIEDEEKIRKILKIYLKNENFDIIEAENGEMGLRMLVSIRPEIVVTDLGLPDMDGKQVIKNIRELSDVPILVCSVRDDDAEIIECLNNGADDYVIKPFNPEILLARINGNLRRFVTSNPNTVNEFLINGPLKIDILKHEISINDKPVFFSPKQYNLLKYLLTNKGKILTHREVLTEIWGKGYLNENQYLRVQIGHIREKIRGVLGDVEIIHTEPGIGYRMEIL